VGRIGNNSQGLLDWLVKMGVDLKYRAVFMKNQRVGREGGVRASGGRILLGHADAGSVDQLGLHAIP